MTYRNILRPAGSSEWTSTQQWVDWMHSESLAPSITPVPNDTCRLCHGATGYMYDGDPFARCPQCSGVGQAVSALIPVAYSMDSGLESMLHRYKDWGAEYRWMAMPLGSLAINFLLKHKICIEDTYGAIDTACTVPRGNTARDFDHLAAIISSVKTWPVQWELDLLRKVKDGRPGRGVMDGSYYAVDKNRDVAGDMVLLFDDTWTSGSSIASAAEALKDAGAATVVAFTIGRQLHAGWGSADAIIEELKNGPDQSERCVICE